MPIWQIAILKAQYLSKTVFKWWKEVETLITASLKVLSLATPTRFYIISLTSTLFLFLTYSTKTYSPILGTEQD